MGSSRLLKTYLRYYAFSSGTFPTAADETLMAAGRIPVFSLQNQFGTTYTITWAAVAGGSNDTQLNSIAAAVQAGGQPCFIEYEAEPDDGGKIGGGGTLGSAADHVSAFQHVSTVLRAGAPGLIATCWTVSGGNSTSQPTYPGDAYVDWICVDPYDSTLSKGSATNTCSPFVTWLNTDPLAVGGGSGSGGGHGKPLGIMETGVQDSQPDASIAAWLQGGGSYGTGVPAALAALSTTWGSRYQTWNWFNSSGTLGTDTIKTDGSMPLTIAAMQAIAPRRSSAEGGADGRHIQNFEASTSGTTLTNGNAGGTGNTNFNYVNSAGTIQFDSTHAMHGTTRCTSPPPPR